jgi:hypothetical protein
MMPATRDPGLSLDYAVERAERVFGLSGPLAPVSCDQALADIHDLTSEVLILLKSIRHNIYGAEP